MAEYVIGIDGGGTKTNAVLVSLEGEARARAQGETSNYQVIGTEKLQAVLQQTILQLLDQAGVQARDVRHLVVALAGVGRPSDREAVSKIVEGLRLSEHSTVDSDAAAALSGAFAGGEGVIVISGTGTICFGRGADGSVERSGGWGYLLGDEGSGYFIGQQAIAAALKDLDGRGPTTALRVAIERRYDLERIDGIIPRVYQGDIDCAEIASLAPVVFEVAVKGDSAANDIIGRAGEELGLMAAAVIKRLKWSSEEVRVAPIGSVFRQKKMLLPHMRRALDRSATPHTFVDPMLDPATGAAVIGLQKEGVPIQGKTLEHLLLTTKS